MPRTSVTIEIDADIAAAVRVVADVERRPIRDVYEGAVRSYLGGPAAEIARVEVLKLLDRVAADSAGVAHEQTAHAVVPG